MASTVDESLDRNGHLLLPLALSVLVHLFLGAMFAISAYFAPKPVEPPFEVTIVDADDAVSARAKVEPPKAAEKAPAPPIEAAPQPKTQIVSPPDSPEETPDTARLLSDRDSKALQETVKRGEPAPPAKPPDKTAKQETAKPVPKPKPPETKARGGDVGQDKGTAITKAEPKTSPPSTRTAPVLGLSDLFVRPSELARDPMMRKGQSGEDDMSEKDGRKDIASLAARPELWADPGQRGTPDYLPDIKQGDFTLLNTKADKFAPFVRRVGLRVFQSFSMQFKQQIFSGSVPQGRDDIEVEAVMSKDGRRLQVYLKQRSGNLSSDRVLLGTLNDQIFFDQNPPANAVAEDGLIHFVFALNARVWYAHDSNGRTQPGAHWVFGAGLL